MSALKKEHVYDESLTNELLSKRFTSQFDLVRHAIKLAEYKVRAGKDQTYPQLENIASEVLEDIAEGVDHLEDIQEENEESDINGQAHNFESGKKGSFAKEKEKSFKKEQAGKKKIKL